MSMNGHNGHDVLKVASPDEEGDPSKLTEFMRKHFAVLDEPIHLTSSDMSDKSSDASSDISKSEIVAVFKMMLDKGYPHDQIKDILSVLVKKSSDKSDISSDNLTKTLDDPVARKRARDVEYQRKHRLKVKKPSEVSDDSKSGDTLKEIKIDTEEEVKEKKVRAVIVYSKEFEDFWRAYPRRPNMGKAETFAVWKKISPEERQLATEAAPKFDAWVKTQKPDYVVLHACRFLSKRRADAFQTEPQSKLGRLDIPPWEREGLSKEEFFKRQKEKYNGQV